MLVDWISRSGRYMAIGVDEWVRWQLWLDNDGPKEGKDSGLPLLETSLTNPQIMLNLRC